MRLSTILKFAKPSVDTRLAQHKREAGTRPPEVRPESGLQK